MLQSLWNAQLSATEVVIKGVFCHRTLSDGPKVTSAAMKGPRELADLLFIVSCDGSPAGVPFGNAVFLQAKSERKLSGSSSPEQKKLYEDATEFEFVDKAAVASTVFGEHASKPGMRKMPNARERGFKFWFFENEDWSRGVPFMVPPFGWHPCLAPSTTAGPPFIGSPGYDELFCLTLFKLVVGLDGLGVSVPTTGDFGWSRIVRDVIAMSVSATLGGKNKIVAPLPRTTGALPPGVLSQLIAQNDMVVVSNPFNDLAKAFNDNELLINMDSLAKMERAEWPKPPPPPDQPIRNKRAAGGDGGGGSFVWIRLSEKSGKAQKPPN